MPESMFCPRCGKADQLPETYCRQCGEFLPDFAKISKKPVSPQEHLKINTVFNAMTAIVSITLAILLHSFYLGRDDTSPLIYITAGFLTAMFAWQVQVLYRTLQVKKHFKRRQHQVVFQGETPATNPLLEAPADRVFLREADAGEATPPSVTEQTTKRLAEKKIH